MDHLDTLEAESIHILREVAAEFANPVLLYSIGKDSSVLLHLARKAFASGQAAVPAAARRHDVEVPRDDRLPRRDRAATSACELIVHINRGGPARRRRSRSRSGSARAHRRDEDRRRCGRRSTLHGFDAAIRRRPPRRGEVARQGTHLLASAPPSTAGTRRASAPSCGASTTRGMHAGRDHARVPAVELDRARRLALHRAREHPRRAAVFRRGAAGGASATAR